MRISFLLAAASLTLASPLLAANPPSGYLAEAPIDLAIILPDAPAAGSAADGADRATFRETRALAGTPRWQQAIGDVDESVPAMLEDFSPAAGRTLSMTNTPHLANLLLRMRSDVSAAVNPAKLHFHRRRPFLVDAGPVCQPTAGLAASYDYPSGHTSWGTAVALILAELLPDRATRILARGRSYGDSRIICGAHNSSAVAAGRLAGAAVIARLHADAVFEADLAAAAVELK